MVLVNIQAHLIKGVWSRSKWYGEPYSQKSGHLIQKSICAILVIPPNGDNKVLRRHCGWGLVLKRPCYTTKWCQQSNGVSNTWMHSTLHFALCLLHSNIPNLWVSPIIKHEWNVIMNLNHKVEEKVLTPTPLRARGMLCCSFPLLKE